VIKVLLFGSYIRPDTTELNDVDIAVEITPKYDSPDERRKKSDEYIRAAIEKGMFNEVCHFFKPSKTA
jgi:predicted nucleotidyltransferase